MGLLPAGKRQKIAQFQTQFLGVGIVFFTISAIAQSVLALPPPEDTPEEVLRTEIFLTARSPVDGKPLTAAEYAQLQALSLIHI